MASFLTDLAKSYVGKLINGVIAEPSYICCFTCIANDFEEQRAKLEIVSSTIKQRVVVATRRGEDIQDDALFWEEAADKLIQEYNKTKQKCLFGICPHIILRYKRGKELTNKKETIKRLIQSGKELSIGVPALLPDVEQYSSQVYIHFESRKSKYNELLDALKDDNNYVIGLNGMGGIGKTMLAKKVGKELKQSKQFTQIIDTTVSFSPDIKKIQDDIARPLRLNFKDCSESDRPKKLWKTLTNGEKILLILDDVWGVINFDEIGIPDSDNHKGCRILVTTRNPLVCNKLGCSETIQLEPLIDGEAWTMFQWHADLNKISTKSLLDKGRKIANECKGLPIAISVIASSLKGKHPEVWDEALKSLQKPMHDVVEAGLVKIYRCFKFSYDNMKNEKAKELLLLCSEFREDEEISIERLTRLGIGGGLFGGDCGSYEEARSEVDLSKKKLLNSCLLLEAGRSRVKMHDMVRDAAQWVPNKKIQTVKLHDKNQKEMAERETNIKYLFYECKLKDVFSFKIGGSELEILIITVHMDEDCHNVKIEVPISFFKNNSGLRVFHLSSNIFHGALSLPESIQLLKNIRSLLFTRVDLGDISILGNLQSLETLDLNHCKIDELPHGIKKLKKFRLLNLDDCEIARNDPFDVIEGCSSLQELYFTGSFNEFCREITFPKLKRFYIDEYRRSVNDSSPKYVSIEDKDQVFLSETTLKYCMETAEILKLRRIQRGWINLIPNIVSMHQGMRNIAELSLHCISQLQFLIDTKHTDFQEPNFLSKLVVLKLDRMENLEELVNGPMPLDSLKNLKKLSIKDCKHLRSLFKCKLNCYNLKTIKLQNCPRLESMLPFLSAQELPALETINIRSCDGLKYHSMVSYRLHICEHVQCFPIESNSMCNIKEMNLSHLLEIKSVFILSITPKMMLETLTIKNCDELKNIIINTINHDSDGNNWGKVFPKLERIYVEDCIKLEHIFGHYDHDPKNQNHNEIHLHLPALKYIKLCNLPGLVSMCTKQYRPTFPRDVKLEDNGCSHVAIKSFRDVKIHPISESLDSTIRKEDGDVTTQYVDDKIWQETSNTNDDQGDPSQIDGDLSSYLVVTRELENIISNKHLAIENLSLLTDFLVKHPSFLTRDTSWSSRYKGYSYNCLAELLRFLQTHSALDVLGSSHSEFVDLLQDVRRCGFDKDWLDGVEKHALSHELQFSQNALQKLLVSEQHVTKEVEEMRLKINIFNQHLEDLKHQLTSLETRAALNASLGY